MDRRRVLLLAALVVSACAPLSPPVGSAPASEPSALPATSECTPVRLLSPAGERVDLTGEWEQRISDDQPPVRWWVRQVGSCIWAVTMSPEFPGEQIQGFDLQVLRGELDASFTIRGEIAEVAPMNQVEADVFSPISGIVVLVEFDDQGRPVLSEDREAGIEGPRCPDPFHCLPPIVLTRAD